MQHLGAGGYLLKNSSTSVVIDAIQHIRLGAQAFFENKVTPQEKEKNYFTADFLRKLSFTRRKATIIRCAAREMITREITDALFM